MSPPTSRKFTLWGFKLPGAPEPKAFLTASERDVLAGKRQLRADGWTAQYYREGVAPVGLRNRARHAGPDPRIMAQHTNATDEEIIGNRLRLRVRCLCGWLWVATTEPSEAFITTARKAAVDALAEHIDEQLHPEGAEDAAVSR